MRAIRSPFPSLLVCVRAASVTDCYLFSLTVSRPSQLTPVMPQRFYKSNRIEKGIMRSCLSVSQLMLRCSANLTVLVYDCTKRPVSDINCCWQGFLRIILLDNFCQFFQACLSQVCCVLYLFVTGALVLPGTLQTFSFH